MSARPINLSMLPEQQIYDKKCSIECKNDEEQKNTVFFMYIHAFCRTAFHKLLQTLRLDVLKVSARYTIKHKMQPNCVNFQEKCSKDSKIVPRSVVPVVAVIFCCGVSVSAGRMSGMRCGC